VQAIRLLLVDDQRNVRRGLRMRLELEPDITVVGEADDGATALDCIRSLSPDVVVLDVEMSGMSGIEVAQALRREGGMPPVVVLTIHDDSSTKQAAADAGCRAFVAKHEPSEKLIAAIREAAAGSAEAAPV
jgi:DNA-binding NarL/FixJ family response regulator